MKIGQQECACLKFHYLGRERTGEAGRGAENPAGPRCQARTLLAFRRETPISEGESWQRPQTGSRSNTAFMIVGREPEAACLLLPWRAGGEARKETEGGGFRIR